MSSKYHPQLFGWFADLAKGPSYFSRLEEELIYVNQTSCMLRRISINEKIANGFFYSKISKNTIMLMVCKPGTYDVITHIIFDHGRSGLLDLSRWGWVNNYMVDFDLFDDEGQSKLLNLAHYEEETKDADLSIYGWPEWMLAAFNAESLEHLAQIKQQYGVK